MCQGKNQLQTVTVALTSTINIIGGSSFGFQYTNEEIEVIFANRNVLLEKITFNVLYDKTLGIFDSFTHYTGVSVQLYAMANQLLQTSSSEIVSATSGASINNSPVFQVNSRFLELNLNLVCQGVRVFDQFTDYDLDGANTSFDLTSIVNFHYRVIEN
jgi:hypothetical protein